MRAAILAGGSGTRLWPLSRRSFPKQFLQIGNHKSLLQRTVNRVLARVSADDLIVITNEDYRFHVMAQLEPIYGQKEQEHILCEPLGRNTAPAIALAVKYFMDKRGAKPEDVLFVTPSDHLISPEERFLPYLESAEEVAKRGHIVTFGITPYRPETGYGYIERGDSPIHHKDRHGIAVYPVKGFVEKPSPERAKEYLERGNFYWNSGMFLFRLDVVVEEFRRHAPAIYRLMEQSLEAMIANFHAMPDISIDYAVMEKTERLMLIPMDVGWSDVGSWDSVYEMLKKDGDGNVESGEVLTIDTKNSLIIGTHRLVTTLGVEDMVVVETDDALLVTRRGETQRIKEVVRELKGHGKRQTDEHLTIYRPWGSYTVLEEGERYKIKRIVVKPKAKLSLQLHRHRSEHWVVIKGRARITIADRVLTLKENESAYVPKHTPHRLENPEPDPLEIIEVQNGDYVGEDDIERLEDDYGR